MGLMDMFFGSPEQNDEKPLPQPVVPFLTGMGQNPYMSFAPQYQAAQTYNPYAFVGGTPYGVGGQYPWNNPYRMDQDAWSGQSQINNGQYFGPGMTFGQPGGQPPPGGQAPPGGQGYPSGNYQGYGPTSGAQGGPQQGGNFQYTPEYENGVYSSADDSGWIPGLFPSAAAQAQYGPAQYYPYMDVAGKTLDQQTADNQLRTFVGGAGQDMLQDQRQIANRLSSGDYLNNPIQRRSAQYAMGLMSDDPGQLAIDKSRQALGAGNLAMERARADQAPTFEKDFGRYGLGRYTTGKYDENPYLTQAISNAASDTTRALNEQILPGLGREAIAAGQYGGSRQQIAEGIAGRGAAEEIAQQATGARFGDYTGWQDRGLRAGEAQMQGDVAAQQAATQRAAIESQHQLGMINALSGLMGAGTGAFGAGMDAKLGAGELGNQASQQAYNLDSLRSQGMESGANLLQQVIDGKVDLNTALRDTGTRDQMLNQLFLNSDKARFDHGQNSAWDNLARWSSILGIGDQTINTRSDKEAGGAGLVDILKLFSKPPE